MSNQNSDADIDLKEVLTKIWKNKIILVIVIFISGFIGYYLHSLVLKEFKISTNLKLINSYEYQKIINKNLYLNKYLEDNKLDEIYLKNPNLKSLINIYADEIINNKSLTLEILNSLNLRYLYNIIINKKNFDNFIEDQNLNLTSIKSEETANYLFENLSINSKINGNSIDVSLNYTDNINGNIFLNEYIIYSTNKILSEIIQLAGIINEKNLLEIEYRLVKIKNKNENLYNRERDFLKSALIRLEKEFEIAKSIGLTENNYIENSNMNFFESVKKESFYDFKKGTKVIKGEIIKINKILDDLASLIDRSEKRKILMEERKILMEEINGLLKFRDYLKKIEKNSFQIFTITEKLEQINVTTRFVYIVRAILIGLFLIFLVNFLLVNKKLKIN